MLEEALAALAATGGSALVQAATTDAWEKAKSGFARLLGRGDKRRTEVIEGRLENTRAELVPLTGAGLTRAREVMAAEWTTRLRDTLEEDPDAAESLRVLLDELATSGVSADHSLITGGDVVNVATSGGVAAGVIHGSVSTSPNPPQPEADKG